MTCHKSSKQSAMAEFELMDFQRASGHWVPALTGMFWDLGSFPSDGFFYSQSLAIPLVKACRALKKCMKHTIIGTCFRLCVLPHALDTGSLFSSPWKNSNPGKKRNKFRDLSAGISPSPQSLPEGPESIANNHHPQLRRASPDRCCCKSSWGEKTTS